MDGWMDGRIKGCRACFPAKNSHKLSVSQPTPTALSQLHHSLRLCFLRQPSYPSPSPGQTILHIPPPSNIRLLPRTVHSYQVFRSLQTTHECEECDKGALFNNYYEMVHYPDPGPCGGTSGSPVVTCPNHPNSSSILLSDTREGRSKVLR